MALNLQLSNLAANAALIGPGVAVLCNGGFLRVYDGSQPPNANTAVSTQNLLVTLNFNATAFSSPVNGVATANAIAGANGVYTSTATWFRIVKSDGVTVVLDGTVGTSGCDMNFANTAIINGSPVSPPTTYTLSCVEAGS